MDEKTEVITREQYDNICKRAKERGITITSKYRKGMKNIKCGDIVLSETKTPRQRP